jgi:threonine dehydrogenase-like Zn-dependent dehydrogenase
MKALKIAASKKFEIVEIPEPVSDGENVIIEVSYVGLCGSDVSIWAIAGPFKDIIIGHEYVGRVIDPGSRKDLKKGDLVTGIPQNVCRECEYCNSGLTNLCPDSASKGGPGVRREGAESR